jgi:signal transduction histidine kinase
MRNLDLGYLQASCVAHDFNNLLTIIAASAEVLARGLSDRPVLLDSAARILEATESASGLARELLATSREGALHRARFDLHDVVQAAGRLLGPALAPTIRLRVHLAAEVTTGLGDASQLQSALMNLGLNARDAMPDGGTIEITTANVVLDSHDVAQRAGDLEPGTYLELVVRDDGVGMAEDVQRRAFDPFFTTKGPGQGTGLGLAAVRKAVTDHRGAIRAESLPQRGTTIRLLLPVKRP